MANAQNPYLSARNVPYVPTLAGVEDWFFLNQVPMFTLYAGHSTGATQRNLIYKQRDPEMSMDDAWKILEGQMTIMDGGDFTLHVPTEANGKGNTVLVRLAQATPAVAGTPSKGSFPGGVDEYIDLRLTNYDLQRELEDLRTAQIGRPTLTDKLLEKLDTVDLGAILGPLGQILGATLASRIQGGGPAQAQAYQAAMHVPSNVQGANASEPTVEHQLGEIVAPMAQHFDSMDEFVKFLRVIVERFNENPAGYKMMIQ